MSSSTGKLFKVPPSLIREAQEAGYPTPKSFVYRLPTVSIEDAAMEAAGSSPMKLGKELAIRCLARVDDTVVANDGIQGAALHAKQHPQIRAYMTNAMTRVMQGGSREEVADFLADCSSVTLED
jgi:hypothetical protein